MRRSWRVGVRRLLHLICLRCGQANAADAKFCGECGGALLRKFCADCHAINDAQAHFCRSCGAALPAQPPAPVSASDEAAPAPSAIEVAYAERAPAHVVTPTPLPLSSIVELPPRWPATAAQASAFAPKAHVLAYRPSLLLGFTGAAAALLIVASWPRFDHARASSAEATSTSATSHVDAAVKAAAVPLAPAAAIAVETPSPVATPPSGEGGRIEAAARPAPLAAVPKVDSRPIVRHATPEALLAAQPPAAGPPRVQVSERPRATRSTPRTPATPAPACTPQVDALGLCEPGAKVIGR